MIEENIVRVGRDEAMSYLKPKLNGYRSIWNRIYIGVTTDPEKRWAKHSCNGWTKMVLLYEAYRADIAIDLERDLIDYAHRCKFLLPPDNINPGGEGVFDNQKYHFLYVLVGK
ncbi:GIY-YIG nuclease family protein [Cystobacter fuscus]